MKKLSRRDFLGRSAFGIGSALIASQVPVDLIAGPASAPVKMPVGFQVWTIKDSLIKDFPGTLKRMAALGYQSMEMCSPPGYESSGFGPLMKLTAKEMKQIINDAGLICPSSHYGMDEFRNHLDERIAFALESGQTQMILSSFGLPQNATLDDWRKAADELNKYGEKARKAGIQMGFHNHHGEFAKIDGTLIYDVLMKQFDPEYIKMQFQVAVISIGYKASDYFKKFPGRFISAHLADWSDTKKTSVPIGQGIVDWKEFFASLEAGGVKNIFAEINEEFFKESAVFLKKL
ncbi:MAG TPA: xylose isomerase [Bacteroidales bacterium]|nr:xylose isomerase [Bacteroidales bacterium]HBZ19505.1 xylose isomerase [Bacteroidales bacterium]